MKHARIALVAPLLVAALATHARAAKEIGLGITYDPRIPIGGLRDFTPDIAAAGLQVKWDYFPLDRLSIGIEGQYHLFQRGLETNTTPIANGAVTAPTFRYASIWSFLPTARYYFSARTFRPYAALGAGVSSTTDAFLVSDLGRRESGLSFIVQPSVGVLWRLWIDPTRTPEGVAAGDVRPVAGAPLRGPIESMFGVTASITCAFTTADVISASNVIYAGIQVGVYAKP